MCQYLTKRDEIFHSTELREAIQVLGLDSGIVRGQRIKLREVIVPYVRCEVD